jgi:hypothetical protein
VLLADVQGKGDRSRVEKDLPVDQEGRAVVPWDLGAGRPQYLDFQKENLSFLVFARVGGPFGVAG